MPGLLGAEPSKILRLHDKPLELTAPGLPYFLASFVVPKDAKPGRFTGTLEVAAGGKPYRSIPVTITVQSLDLPVVRDVYIGWIFQGNKAPPFNDEGLRIYSRGGFTSLTAFFGVFRYGPPGPDGVRQIDLADFGKQMDLLVKYGITGGFAPFSEFDLGPLWEGGRLYKEVKGNKEQWQAAIRRLDAEVRKHAEWPRLIYMTWDEPRVAEPWKRGLHGGVDPRMGWVREALPNELTNVDVSLRVLPHLLKYYNMPTIDDPPDCFGPEVFNFVKKTCGNFGYAGAKPGWEVARYQTGLQMISSGARYFHQWHLAFPNKWLVLEDGQVRWSIDLVSSGEGVTDYKVWRILRDAVAEARASGDAARRAAADAADAYMQSVLARWNADHSHEEGIPALGLAMSWGRDRFYDDWRKEMMRHAAAAKGVAWVDVGER
jgi:hypothetical protein